MRVSRCHRVFYSWLAGCLRTLWHWNVLLYLLSDLMLYLKCDWVVKNGLSYLRTIHTIDFKCGCHGVTGFYIHGWRVAPGRWACCTVLLIKRPVGVFKMWVIFALYIQLVYLIREFYLNAGVTVSQGFIFMAGGLPPDAVLPFSSITADLAPFANQNTQGKPFKLLV